MKIIRTLVPYVVIAGIFYRVIVVLFPAPCARPLAYSIGQVDEQFDISKDQFLAAVQQAETVWEQRAGKQLFEHAPDADFTINLIYDSRQQVIDQAKAFSDKLSTMSSQQKKAQDQYDKAYAAYVSAKDAYLADTQTVRSYDQLEKERMQVNKLADSVNALATKEQQTVQTYNANVRQFNQLYAGQREFDQGEYTGYDITIYEFSEHNDLQLALEHELGHALGIGHVENPASIMYYRVNEKNLSAKTLSSEDVAALQVQCKKTSLELFWERLQIVPFFAHIMQFFDNQAV